MPSVFASTANYKAIILWLYHSKLLLQLRNQIIASSADRLFENITNANPLDNLVEGFLIILAY